MYRILLFLFLALVVSSCNLYKTDTRPDYIIGKTKLVKPQYSKDSLQIMTPAIEFFNMSNRDKNYEYRNSKSLEIKILLNEILPQATNVSLDVLQSDYRSLNKLLERRMFEKHKDPKKKISISDKLIAGTKKYSLLVFLNGRYGKSENGATDSGVLYVLVINNEEKTLELSKRKDYTFSPLKKEMVNELILNTVKDIIIN